MSETTRSFSSPSPPPPPPPSNRQPPLAFEVVFSVPVDQLPEPLPSPNEIEDSPNVIKDLFSRCTTCVGASYVARYGVEVEPLEAENMRFIREHTTEVIVPQVFAIYQRSELFENESDTITYIIMEYVPAETLEHQWAGLSSSEKSSIASQLRKAFDSLRNIPHPGYFGSLQRSKLREDLLWTPESVPAINGPFASEDEFIQGIINQFARYCNERMPYKAEYYRRLFPKILRGDGSPAFTHNDFQPKNIIIRPDGKVVLVGWAASGWYPSYWEYAATLLAWGHWKHDWSVYVAEILTEFPNHYAWLNTKEATSTKFNALYHYSHPSD